MHSVGHSRTETGQLDEAAGTDRVTRADLRRELIIRLRERRAGLKDAAKPILAKIDRLFEAGAPIAPSIVDDLRGWHGILLDALSERYDALDSAAKKSEIPFVEVDGTGRITYSNDALNCIVPNPKGQLFAGLFEDRSIDVTEALDRGRNGSLRVELRRNGRFEQFRLEVGPLRDEYGEPGNYALLLSQRAEEMRHEAAGDAILRTDMSGAIKFANSKACHLLDHEPTELAGMRVADLFTAEPENGRDLASHWLAASQGITGVAQISGAGGRLPCPVRVSVMPNFDEPGRQSGLLINFSSLPEETAREKLRSLLSVHRDPKVVIHEAIRTLRATIPSDLATFGVYSDNMGVFRALVVDPEPSWPWSTRWFEVDPKVVEWLRSGRTYTDDISNFMRENAPDQQGEPVAQAVVKDKLNRMLVLPIAGPGGRFRSALTLLSRDHIYTASDLQALKELGLEEILQAADAAMEREQAARIRTLSERLSAAKSTRDLTLTLAQGVVECFGWEYAAIFRLNRAPPPKFELFEQFDRTGGDLTVDPDYVQDLDVGMLGHSYRRQKVVVLPEVAEESIQYTDAEGETFRFVKTAGNRQRSAMVVPLRVRNRIELLLDLESTQSNSFAGPDRAAATALADDCAKILESRWHEAIGSALIDAIEQAAVVVDSAGDIRQVNAAARAVFGACIGRALSSLGAGAIDQALLGETRPRDPTYLTLAVQVGPDKAPTQVPTLASQRPLNDDYRHRLWLFTNLREQRWERDWRYLDETVSEVARHTRAPLLIADGLLRGAADLLRQPGFADRCARLLNRAANQLAKANLPLERLSETLAIREQPLEPAVRFNVLAQLRYEIGTLASEDSQLVTVEATSCDDFFILGWPARLGFAFRSLLGALLLARDEGSVSIKAALEAGDLLVIRMALAGGEWPTPAQGDLNDPIAEGQERARQMVALAPESVASAIEQHGGTLQQPGTNALVDSFVIRLPRTPVGTP